MPRELLLLRHGKSDWNTNTDDFNRPLKDRGKRGAQRMGVWLSQQRLVPDLVITSPAERALVSAEKCCKVMGMGASNIEQENRIYESNVTMLLKILASCSAKAQRVMLVGHNPGLEQLLLKLANPPPVIPPDGKLMPTATLARLAMPDDWGALKQGDAKLLQLIRGSSLAKKFPFPTPQGEEKRDRPAYYYSQSSVVPYRFNDGSLELLIIRSSKNKHWVVPKGIADPGLSLQDSARKEAWEEAGVEGRVLDDAIGNYTYSKWGATCAVTVYPMEVSRQLPPEEWEERHRGRRWVSPQEAAKLLKQGELHAMVLALQQRLTQD
ncbi:MAG: NUDIX domain-containing protein [Aestuariibacter sp.]|nr:NUDIX domain-containing protein [Aestuariibacter sp.]